MEETTIEVDREDVDLLFEALESLESKGTLSNAKAGLVSIIRGRLEEAVMDLEE